MNDVHAPAKRYAIYFSPDPGGSWWMQWSAWLGRCAINGQTLEQPVVAGLSPDEFFSLTAAPRRYGLHATLKAPMRLAHGVSPQQLMQAVKALCAEHSVFVIPPLQVVQLSDFLALTPSAPSPQLKAVADACVTKLDRFRTPLAPAELAKRRPDDLSAREREHLERWGYPYVLDMFRFHISLTGSLTGIDPRTIEALKQAAQQHLNALAAEPLVFDAVSVFEEPAPDADFMIAARIPLV
jgi:putative phosphonate metabolism protein